MCQWKRYCTNCNILINNKITHFKNALEIGKQSVNVENIKSTWYKKLGRKQTCIKMEGASKIERKNANLYNVCKIKVKRKTTVYLTEKYFEE